jgi:hypothetical protein
MTRILTSASGYPAGFKTKNLLHLSFGRYHVLTRFWTTGTRSYQQIELTFPKNIVVCTCSRVLYLSNCPEKFNFDQQILYRNV